ncbi:hexosaminidase D isoform X5 [Hydra vulgaris]|uniref:beta-N-acetylhexosaminidase n=1 Tax=Hydra vulgaris TaxID=6087 RepID=A0ABM4BEI5_HYDVU
MNTMHCCQRLLKSLVVLFCFLLLMVVWFELPIRKNYHHNYLLLQKELNDLNMKLFECNFEKNKISTDSKNYVQVESFVEPVLKVIKLKTQRTNFKRIVHFDLKGAPPKHSYFLKLLPLLKSLGASGLLIEYEDMFPYSGLLHQISSPFAYSKFEIQELLDTAKKLNLEVIPLVQTFGHFEFVLKHEQFRYLRETPEYANLPCPLHNETLGMVLKMIDQVLYVHPDITLIHLGGDEVFNLKDCARCKASGMQKEHIYLHHMVPILKYIKKKTNLRVRPIIWDDMIRNWPLVEMQKLSNLTDIMVWGYGPNLDNHFPKDMWEKYLTTFKSLWLASSFKGALSPNNNIPPIPMHIKNHESWLRILEKNNVLETKISGIALTGWARYDHFATLCELLPAALPSLGLTLTVLKEGVLKSRSKEFVESLLSFSNEIMVEKDPFGSWDTAIPGFTGGDVYALVAELENHISWVSDNKRRLDSWVNDRQKHQGFVSVFQLNAVADSLKQLIPSFGTFRNKCFKTMAPYFYEHSIDEWVKDKIDPYILLSDSLNKSVWNFKRTLVNKNV